VVAPYSWNVGNLVGGNVWFPNTYLTGRGGRKLMQGWPWPRRTYTTPAGKLVVAPYSWNVGNLVGANVWFPNTYLTGRGGK
jgi:hypothetical protein